MNKQEHTFLPQTILSELYKNVMVAEKVAKVSQIEEPAIGLKAIILTQGEKLNPGHPQLIFLQNILKACKTELAETVLLTATDNTVSGGFESLHKTYQAPIVLLFGLNPSVLSLPIHFPAFQVQAFQQSKYMWAPGLDEIAADKSLKVTLWQCLQKIFGL